MLSDKYINISELNLSLITIIMYWYYNNIKCLLAIFRNVKN